MSPIIGTISGSRGFGRGGAGGAFIIASGGTISQVDGYRIHTFTSGTSTFSIASAPPNATIEVLVVGGGGPGGNGLAGGGGGGGVIHNLAFPVSAGSYNVIVGAQSPQSGDRSDATGSASGRGYDTTFGSLTAIGGGQGGWWDSVPGRVGGSGGGYGGGSSSNDRGLFAGALGTAGQGYQGGPGRRYPANNQNNHWAGGGGGAGGPGRTLSDYEGYGADSGGGDGGPGYLCGIDGTARYWAGGGGGSVWTNGYGGRGGLGGGGGGNVSNSSNFGTGGGGALNSGAAGGNEGGAGGTNTGGGGGGSAGNAWSRGPGGAGGSGIVIVRYPYLPTASGLTGNLGLTQETAAESAVAIKRAWANAPDRAYWIKPSGQSEAYYVHCLMSIEGGGWELAWRHNSTEFGPFGSGTFLVGNWGGWAWSTKSQVDTIGNYATWGDNNAFAPTYYARDFTDCMIIANRTPSTRKIGVRFNPGRSSLLACINQPNEIRASSLLFGSYNMQTSLQMRPDSNVSYNGGTYFAFKSGSEDHPAFGDFTGGHNAAGWTRYQVGCGRDDQNPGGFGGGIGAAAWNNAYHRMSGHYWGHGDGRNGSVWSGDRSSPFEGHAFYVRKEAP